MPPNTRSKTASNTKVAALGDDLARSAHSPSVKPDATLPHGDDVDSELSLPRPKRQPRKSNLVKSRPRGNLGRLEQIINMPLEIFAEIASYLKIEDLVSLSRASRLLRRTLITRSAINMWRAAERNVDGLPPCPPDLSHPQYAVLLFFKNCSICGNITARNLIFGLRVRLCSDCADVQIVTIDDIQDVELIPVVPVPRSKKYRYLKRDLDSMVEDRSAAIAQGAGALAQWQAERKLNLAQHAEHTKKVEAYITQVEAKRGQEILALKTQRHKDAQDRLLALGWEQSEVERVSQTMAWKWYVLEPKPLTDRIWNHVYPQILGVLLRFRAEGPPSLIQKRLADRKQRLHKLLAKIHITYPPLLGLTIADTPRRPEPSYAEPHLHDKFPQDNRLEAPFPTTAEVLTWPLLAGFVERDVPVVEMEAAFNQLRDEISQAIRVWKTRVDNEVMDIWRQGHPNQQPGDMWQSESETNSPSSLVVGALPSCTLVFSKPDGTATEDISELPESLQLLLRADTMFKDTTVSGGRYTLTHPLRPKFYPDILPWLSNIRIGTGTILQGDTWNPAKFTSYNAAEKLARGLLVHLGRPNATHAELEELGHRFFCQRCDGKDLSSWDTLLEHYIEEHQTYLDAQEKLKLHSGRESIMFRDNHDIETPLDRPLLKIISRQEFESFAQNPTVPQDDWVTCDICETLEVKRYAYLPGMLIHLQDVHDILAPVVGQHYTIRKSKRGCA